MTSYLQLGNHAVEYDGMGNMTSFGDTHMTQDEIERFHLSMLKLSYEEAVSEYEKCRDSKLGRLIANRELPILKQAKELLDAQAL